ncbi:hypothetical protein ACP70R_008396 [Stipagrostis hirtigluma subsp. patula]
MGLGPAVDMSEPQSSQSQGSQRKTAANSSNREPHSSQPEVQQHSQGSQPSYERPVWMNNDQGIGLYHDIEGGPSIRPT